MNNHTIDKLENIDIVDKNSKIILNKSAKRFAHLQNTSENLSGLS